MCKFKHAFNFMLLACQLEHRINTNGKIQESTSLMATKNGVRVCCVKLMLFYVELNKALLNVKCAL